MNESLKQHLLESLKKGARIDGRKFDEYRDVVVETGVSKTAEGSARVKIGETEVIVGIKLGIEKPYPDTPDEGTMMVNAELLPLSSPEFETGPPGKQAIELARVIDRGIREAKAIDVKELCIEKGEKIWMVGIDICTINDEGNLLDAAGLAALAALQDARFPKYENEELNYKEKTDKKLPLTKLPIAVTVIKIGDNLLVDPLPDEEKSVDARLTVTTMVDGSLCALQKGGEEALSIEEIDKMIELGIQKGNELRKHL
ncbi:exosome complex protein Rrp42 [Candidatus Woesearchaeota archaeon]|nr:exosome complex protein Rrp42 [Candidatus Woesearchaeota archaeon]